MNVVDSSGWLEYFANGANSDFFAPPIEDVAKLLVPSISLLEVFKRVSQQRGDDAALQAVSLMQQGQILNLDSTLALMSARLGREYKLPLADSVMLASARSHQATLWTQDSDFHGLEGVKYTPKKK